MSQSVIGALRVNLGLDSAQFERGAKKSQSALKPLRAQMLAVAGAAAAVRGALTVMARQSMVTIDAQAKLARAVGGTTTGLQSLARAGDRAGVQQSELAAAATRLNQRLGQAMVTGKGTDGVFKRLGISASALAKMDVDQRFAAIADAMKAAGMNTQEMAFHLRELGIRQSSVITLIQGGSEEITRSRKAVEDFGVAVSEVDAATIERANDALSEVGRVFEGFRNQLAVALAPKIEAMANAFTNMAREGGLVNIAIKTFIGNLERMSAYISVIVAGVGVRYVGAFVAAKLATASLSGALVLLKGAIMRTGIGLLVVGAGELVYWLGKVVSAAGELKDALGRVYDVGKAVFLGVGNTAWGLAEILGGVANSIASGFIKSFAQIGHQWDKLVNAMASAWNVIAGTAFGETLGLGTLGVSNAGGILADFGKDLTNTAVDMIRTGGQRIKNAGLSVTEAVRKSLESVGDSAEDAVAPVDMLADSLDELGEAAGGGGGGKIAGAGATIDDNITDPLAAAREAAERMGQTLAQATSSAIMGAKNAREAFSNLANQLLRMAMDSSIQGLFSGLAGTQRGVDILGALGGIFGGARAMGGPVTGGRTYLVGERGPELFTPSSSGGITPNSAMGGGVQINIVNNSPAQVTAQQGPNGRIDVSIDQQVAASLRAGPQTRAAMAQGYGLTGAMR